MSIWLQMAREAEAGEALADSVRTRDKTHRMDKTPAAPGQNRVLSGTAGFCPSGENSENPRNGRGSWGFVRSVPISEGQSPKSPEPTRASIPPSIVSEAAKPGHMVRLVWSGEWVSRDRYDAMTDLERHGPQGRFWCGRCQRYQPPAAAGACLDGETCR